MNIFESLFQHKTPGFDTDYGKMFRARALKTLSKDLASVLSGNRFSPADRLLQD
jgi:hypothetical protein